MEWILRFGWLISFAGYTSFFAGRIHRAFAPLLAMCVLGLAVYLLGLCRLMHIGMWLQLTIGLALFVHGLTRKRRVLIHTDMGLFLLGCVLLFCRYRGSLLVAYDDFSHWGMLVRRMLLTDALPISEDTLIVFQSYPPGAACWIWYVCRFLGQSNGMLLCAQAWLTLAAIWPLTALIGTKGRIAKTTGTLIVAVITLSVFQGTASLMVDNLLAAFGIGASAMLAFYALKNDEPLWIHSVVWAMLCLVKDSGLFLAAACAAIWLALAVQRESLAKSLGRAGLLILLPVLVRALWYAHIKLDFPAADVTRHALTLANLRKTGADKSYADMLFIAKKLLAQGLNLQNQSVHALGLFALVYALLRFCGRISRKELWIPIAALLTYAGWLIGLLLMYIFSMPLSGSLQLTAFERYNSTCALFLYGGCAAWLLRCLWEDGLPRSLAVLTLALPLLLGSWRAGIPRLFKENYFVPLRSQMEALAQERPLKPEETAILLLPRGDIDTSYARYMARYVFQSAEISVAFEDPGDVDVTYVIPEEN